MYLNPREDWKSIFHVPRPYSGILLAVAVFWFFGYCIGYQCGYQQGITDKHPSTSSSLE